MATSPNPRTFALGTPRRSSDFLLVERIEGGDFSLVIAEFLGQRRTGQITLHVLSGRVCSIETKRKTPHPSTPFPTDEKNSSNPLDSSSTSVG